MTNNTILKILTSAAALSLVGFVSTISAMGHLALEVSDQPAGTSVTIEVVNMHEAGFVTIHGSDADGNMIAPASLGHTYVEAGLVRNVTVELSTFAPVGAKLFAMLHEDTGKLGIYEFGVNSTEFDGPYIHDGKPAILPIAIK